MYATESTAAVSPRIQQVPDAVQSVDHLSASLMNAIEELQRRLVPVLRDEPTKSTNGEAKDAHPMVPLAHSLSCSCHKLRSAIESVESILGRLEL